MNVEEEYIGYLKYTGKSVESGLFDTRKSAEALLGFDEVLRFFLIKENPILIGTDFEIPVRIKKGSWEIAIPVGVITLGLGVYATETAKKAAQDGLLSTGLAKDTRGLVIAAIKSAQWMIKIGSHIGTLKKIFDKGSFDPVTGDALLANTKGKYLRVPKKYFSLFTECPARLFAKNARLIEKERIMEFGVIDAGIEEKVIITDKEKSIYFTENEETDVILPELVEGKYVELEGTITRGNEKRNTVGFEYMGHILTCIPQEGNIASYKDRIISRRKNHFFPPVKMMGLVDRTSVDNEFKEKKPRIIFSQIVLLEKEEKNLKLF